MFNNRTCSRNMITWYFPHQTGLDHGLVYLTGKESRIVWGEDIEGTINGEDCGVGGDCSRGKMC